MGSVSLTRAAGRPSDWLDITRKYSVMGDGSRDDSQGVIDALTDTRNNDKWLYVPPGTYYVPAIKSSNALANNAKIRIFSMGGARLVGDGSASQFYFGAADLIAIHGLRFEDFERGPSYSDNTGANDVGRVEIVNCEFGANLFGINFFCKVGSSLISRNRFESLSSAAAISAIQIGYKDDTDASPNAYEGQGKQIITNNYISGVTSTAATAVDVHGIIVRGLQGRIAHNYIENITRPNKTDSTGCEGIYMSSWSGDISHNSLYNAGYSDGMIVLKGGVTAAGLELGDCIVSHNTLRSDQATTGDGIGVYTHRTSVEHNTIVGVNGKPIWTSTADYASINNNKIIRQRGDSSIRIDGDHTECNGNTIVHPQNSSTDVFGIYTSPSAAAERLTIKDNRVIFDSGTNSATNVWGVYVNISTAAYNNVTIKDNEVDYTDGAATNRYPIGVAGSAASSDWVIEGNNCDPAAGGNAKDMVRFVAGTTPSNIVVKDNYGESNVYTIADSGFSPNPGASGIVIYNTNYTVSRNVNLPNATPGLEFTIVRDNATNDIRFNPQNTDVIRGVISDLGTVSYKAGAAGEFLRTAEDGAFIHVKCHTSGVWDVIASSGQCDWEL